MRVAAGLLMAALAYGQGRFEFWPGAAYDPAVPSIEKVLGYAPGERITRPGDLVRYLEALAGAAPARVKVYDYAKSWEGRRLVYAAVGSEANLKRMGEIKANLARLSDPRKTSAAEAAKLIEGMPAIVWLGYGVHGNEISSPDAALLAAYHLTAARKDAMAEKILANTIVLIDPTQNPDGRNRFVHHFEQSEGIEPNAEPAALEHTEPWPGGRTNHYHFDLNRDWFALTQPETRGRIRVLLEWLPQVFVDLHEMGANSTYYFAPEAVPYNPHLTEAQRTSLDWFGKNNAAWFDKYGFSYFTREVYDAFYPGYGASWPAYYGAIAMTYEQASARGLLMRRNDETTFHFRDSVRHHFVASLATCETAAARRVEILTNLRKYRESAIEEGSRENIREYVLLRKPDPAAADKLARILAAQGIEVRRGPDRYLVALDQPLKRMIRTLLDPQVDMEAAFLKEQERRRGKNLPDEIYDVTGWSLPLLFNVEAVASKEKTPGNLELLSASAPAAGAVSGQAEVAYLAPWGNQASARFLAAALRAGLRVHSTDKSFTQSGRVWDRGTLIVKVKENAAGLHDTVRRLAVETGAELTAANSGWVDAGVNFGSSFVNAFPKPRVAIAWDTPVAAGSAGHTRFVLERQYAYPTTPVRVAVLGDTDLSRFDVLVLPDGNYGTATTLRAKLKPWVNAGGTLIGIGGAMALLAEDKDGLLTTRRENLPRPTPAPKPLTGEAGQYLATEADLARAIAPNEPRPDLVAGVLARATSDADHWLTAGAPGKITAMVNGRDVYSPLKIGEGVNAALFAGPGELLASGYLWEENRKLLAYKPAVMVARHGRGWAIGFTTDPNYRAFLDGMNTVFLNAVFRGPAHR